MYRKQARRRRAVLALLLVASLALLTVYFGETANGLLHSIQRGAIAVVSPVEKGASRALKPARDLVGWVDSTLSATSDNERLRAENARLRAEVVAGENARSQNAELRRLVGLRAEPSFPEGLDAVAARVIARSPTVWTSTVTIDAGSDDGVEVDDPVIASDGLVGRVRSVTSSAAAVQLITDQESAVSAVVLPDRRNARSRVGGVVRPEVGDPSDLLVEFIERGRRIRRGWTVVTAGWRSGRLESRFPPGIPIGRVTRATVAEQETYQRVHVRPFADLRRIEVVQVLTDGRRGDAQAPRDARAEAAP